MRSRHSNSKALLLGILVFALFGIGNEIAQAAPSPPKECTAEQQTALRAPSTTELLLLPVKIPQFFERTTVFNCTSTKPEEVQGINFPNKNKDCANFCRDGGGLVLEYQASLQSTCFGIEEARACEVIGDQWRNLATGAAITKQQAATINPEACDFADVACWIRNLMRKVANIGAMILDSVVRIVAGGVQTLAALLQEAMMRVIQYFMGQLVSPSNTSSPGFVQAAWNFTRNLANNFFILILAFIGLATILRLQSYQFQKTLPALLLVALLVNFSGVLVGLVVDVGNIITNNFLQLAKGAVWSNINFIPSFDTSKAAQNLALDIVRIIYYLISSLIFLGVMIAFGLRTIVLWTLAIVSPLAFVAYILPATRGLATGWWKQLIQWALFGIPLSFFLLLASMTLNVGNVPSGPTVGVLSNFLAPFTTLFLLFTGITMSMAMAPAAAQSIIEKVNQTGKKWGGVAGLAAGSAVWRKVGGKVEGAGKWLQEKGGAMGTAPQGSSLLRKSLATGAKWSGAGLVTRWAGRGVEIGSRQARMRVGDKDTREQKAAMGEVGDRDSFDIFALVNEELNSLTLKGRPTNWNRITGLLNGVRARGDGDDIEDALFKDDAAVKLDKKVLGQAIKTGLRIGPPGFRPLLKSFMGDIMVNPEEFGFSATRDKTTGKWEGKDAQLLTKDLGIERILSKFSAQDWQGDTIAPRNFDMDTEQGRLFMQLMIKERGADFMAHIARRPRKAESIAAMQYIFQEGKYAKGQKVEGLGDDWLLENGAESVLTYIDSPGARSLGIGAGRTRQQMDAKIEQWKQKQTKEDLLNEQAHLEAERQELQQTPQQQRSRGERTRLTSLNRRLQQIEEAKTLMDVPLEGDQGLQKQIDDLQRQIAEATSDIGQNETNLDAYRRKAAAEQKLRPLQQELRRRGPERPVEEQIAEDLTDIRTRLQARTSELQNFIQHAQGPAGALDSAYQQLLPVWQAELAGIPNRIQDVETGLRQIEGLRIPEAPAPLPKILQDMSSGLRATLSTGEEMKKDIEDQVGRMRQLLTNVRGAEQEINRISNEMRISYDRINEINNEEAAGRIDANLQREREELQNVVRRSLEAQRRFGEEMAADVKAASTRHDTILERQQELEGIRSEVTPLYEEYQGRKEDAAVQKRVEQRRKRRKTS